MSDESFTDKVARCKQLLPLPDLMAKVGHGTGKSDTDGNFLISSPFRQDRNPSFSVYRKDGEWKWKDHGTHEGGDELEYIVKMEGYDKSDALRWYQELCGIVEDGSKPIDPPAPPYNWSPCKEAMDEKKIEIVASARGLPIDFCKAMVQANYIGNYNYQTAFPVFNKSYTKLVAVHYKTSNGKWGYEPSGTKTTALIFGDIRHAKDVYWCESQWDAMAAAAALGWMPNDQSCRHIAFASSRGMSNGQLIGDLPVSKKARIILLTQNDEAGTAWEEKSIKAIREKLEMPVYKVFTVAPHKDINDWYKAGDFEIDIQRELENPKRIKKEGELPCPDDATSFLGERIVTPPELIKGVMHQGTKAVIGGPSKAYKTWDLMDLGVSVATGSDWWEFPCSKGNVLYLNFEIPRWGFQSRLDDICRAKGVKLEPGQMTLWNLRGFAADFQTLMAEVLTELTERPYSLLIIDPTYMVMGDREENSAKDMNNLMNVFEQICFKTGVGLAFVAHFTKGNASSKEAMDRISGSGVFGRNPDTIITLSPHDAGDDYFTVDFNLRNFPRVAQFVVMRDHPIKKRCPELDPADIRKPANLKREMIERSKKKEAGESKKSKQEKEDMKVAELLTEPMKSVEWEKKTLEELAIKHAKFHRILPRLQTLEVVVFDKETKCYSLNS